MGLLERALEYKQKINDSGKETLIDRIKGPAESEITATITKIDINEFDFVEETPLNSGNSYEPDNALFEKKDIPESENKFEEEDIIIFNEEEYIPPFSENNDLIRTNHLNPVEKKELAERSDQVLLPVKDNESEIQINENKDFEMPEFNDYGTLFEIQKEFIKAETVEDVYSTILFSIMGQIGVSSVSIIASSKTDLKKWVIIDSHGIKVSENDVFWEIDNGILRILNTYKGLLDVEDFKNENDLREDYYKFTAVDARIITPLIKDGLLAGAILVGEKISSEDFTEIEMEFLKELSDIGSTIIESLSKYEKISTELLGLRIEKEISSDVELFQESLLNVNSVNELGNVIRSNFYSLGLESYAIFMTDQLGGDYYPAYFESEDLLGFANSGFKIKRDNRLITFLINKKSSIILENFNESSVIIDTFGRNRLIKMESFISYPFIISGKLSGFITIFKINPAVDIIDIDIRLQKINRFIFPYLYRVYELDPELNKFNDLTANFYDRIENEIKHALGLNIPVSLILFTIKNYKRFYERFGKIELEKLFNISSNIIKSKLSAGDFSSRIDRFRFLVVLPGKEKRYSIMLSNSIKNEICDNYNMSDFKLLITSLNSVFPEDGNDLFSLLEVLE